PRNGSRADRDRAELHVAARLQARFALGHRVADIDHETVIGRFVGFRERTLQQGVEVTHESGSNSRLSFSVPLRTCDFTVPRGRPVISTISEWLSPSPWFSVTQSLSASLNLARAFSRSSFAPAAASGVDSSDASGDASVISSNTAFWRRFAI